MPKITIPKVEERGDMERFEGGEFLMGAPEFGPMFAPRHSRTVGPFLLDKTEVTVAAYRKAMQGLPLELRAAALAEDDAVRMVTYDEAVACAEAMGKRLPDEVEYEFAATNGGKNRFPWGDDFERIIDWPIGPVGVPSYDRALDHPTVAGLYSNVAEWTSSWHVPYPVPMLEVPPELRAELRKQRIVRGGAPSAIKGKADPQGKDRQEIWDARDRCGNPPDEFYKGLGFRCARSAKPRFPETPDK
jgi:formylglycine-generating enzyme required for sulfatase activity